MVIYLLVDVSASMSYAGAERQSKYILAAKIAAALAYLMINQGDKAALALFAEKLTEFVPPGGTRRHLHKLVAELEAVRPASTTGLARAIARVQSALQETRQDRPVVRFPGPTEARRWKRWASFCTANSTFSCCTWWTQMNCTCRR